MDDAIAEYQQAIRVDAERPEAHMNLAGVLREREQWEEAVSHYEAALARGLDPRASLMAHVIVGGFHIARESWEEAEKHLLQALDLAPDDFMVNYCLALVYANIDWGERERAARGKAVAFARKAVKLDLGDEDARKVARLAMDAYEEAKPPGQVAPTQTIEGAESRWWRFWGK